MKVCKKCRIEKEESEFYIAKNCKSGLNGKCKECMKENSSKRYHNNPKEINKKQAEYNSAPERQNKIAEYQSNYRKLNRKKLNKYQEERRANNPLFKMAHNLRTLIGNSFSNNGYPKNTKTATILGCSFEEFITYIEDKFQEGMSWDNRNLWHLDHIYPVSLAESEEHLIQLNHFSNFQPLWAFDNLSKGNKII